MPQPWVFSIPQNFSILFLEWLSSPL
jgi:hypothetical protein